MAEFTPEELATINEIMRQQNVGSGSTTDQEFQAMQQAMTPDQRPVGSGSTSDQEMQVYQQMLQDIQSGAMTPEAVRMQMEIMQQMQPVQPQNFGALPPQQGPVGSGSTSDKEMEMMRGQMQQPQEMQGEQAKAQYLQQQIEAIRSRMGSGAPQTGSQRVMDAMGALPPQQGAMTDQEIAMMRGQR